LNSEKTNVLKTISVLVLPYQHPDDKDKDDLWNVFFTIQLLDLAYSLRELYYTLIIFCEVYKLWSFSLYSLLQPPATSSLLGPNILITVFSNTLNQCIFHSVRNQVSHLYKMTSKISVLYILNLKFLERRLEDKRLWTEGNKFTFLLRGKTNCKYLQRKCRGKYLVEGEKEHGTNGRNYISSNFCFVCFCNS
jgi:hypothetical protein